MKSYINNHKSHRHNSGGFYEEQIIFVIKKNHVKFSITRLLVFNLFTYLYIKNKKNHKKIKIIKL